MDEQKMKLLRQAIRLSRVRDALVRLKDADIVLNWLISVEGDLEWARELGDVKVALGLATGKIGADFETAVKQFEADGGDPCEIKYGRSL